MSGVQHVGPKEFGAVIARAMELPGFGPEQASVSAGTTHLVGFGRETMLGAAPEVSLPPNIDINLRRHSFRLLCVLQMMFVALP